MEHHASPYHLGHITATRFAASTPANPVILLPLGSQETHGPALPMGDYLTAEILALRIAQAVNANNVPCFTAPCLPFGAADYFGDTPGGLAIAPASFRAVLADLIAGLHRSGLTRIVILNGHGGNAPVIHEVTLAVKRATGLVIPSFYLWKIARQLMERAASSPPASSFGHGGEPLLSLTAALRGPPEAGAPFATAPASLLGLPVSGFGTLDFHGLPIDAPTESAAAPKPAPAMPSIALGGAIAESLVASACAFICHFDNVASASGVSKSSSTDSSSTAISATNSI